MKDIKYYFRITAWLLGLFIMTPIQVEAFRVYEIKAESDLGFCHGSELSKWLKESEQTNRMILWSTKGTSDKVYILTLFKEGNAYFLEASWGKRPNFTQAEDVTPNQLPSTQLKLRTDKSMKAMKMMQDLKDAKIKKGYELVLDE